jgi:hypothetical protein
MTLSHSIGCGVETETDLSYKSVIGKENRAFLYQINSLYSSVQDSTRCRVVSLFKPHRQLFTYHSDLFQMTSGNVSDKDYPPNLTASESEQLLSAIKDWSIANGLAVRPPVSLVKAEADPHGVLATTAPVTLFPSPFPRVCFQQAKSIQRAYNKLYAAIAQDQEFLGKIVQE